MYNIKIKSVPNRAKTGQQLDYSLVDRNTLFLKPDTQVQSDVKNTISAVPRDKANIEAEGGETIIGDTNNDGFLEHQTIVGKRHSKGGVPLNVPEGSFIFSDTDKLRIKDPEILKMFGMAVSKKGYTPAEIAKKYQVNDYMAILKDDTKDKYSKETAQIMLDSNIKKLGMLALVQESMKGFPDGVPAIAESVMEGMMGGGPAEQQEEEQQGQPEARYGGLTTYQKAGTVRGVVYDLKEGLAREKEQKQKNKIVTNIPSNNSSVIPGLTPSGNPAEGFTLYKGLEPVTIKPFKHIDAIIDNPGAPYIRLSDGTNLTKAEFDTLIKKGTLKTNIPGFNDVYSTRQMVNKTTIKDSSGNPIKGFDLYSGDKFNFKNKSYTVIDPLAGGSLSYSGSGKMWRDIFDNTQGIIKVKDQYGNEEFIEAEDLGDAYKFDKGMVTVIPNTVNRTFYQNMLNPKYRATHLAPSYGVTASSVGEMTITGKDGTTTNSMGVQEQIKQKEVGKPKPVKSAMPVTAPLVKKQGSPLKTDVSPSSFIIDTSSEEQPQQAYGGSIYKMQVGGTPRFNSATGMYQNYDAQGKPVGAPYKTGTTYDVRDKDLLEKAKAAGYEVIGNKYAPNVSYIPEQTSKTGFAWNPESGYYENKQFPVGKQGLEETVNNWKDELDQYSGPSGKGVEAWKKDFIGQKGKEGAASKYLVDKANEYSVAAGAGPQVDVTQKGAYIPGQDVFSLKKFKKAPAEVVQKTDTTPSIERGAPEIMQKAITPTIGRKTRGWFTPDVLNLANAFGRRIGKFPPTLEQVAFQTGPYNLLSPEGEIAKIQSSGNMLSNQAANTMAGNVAFGAGLGVQGQAIDRVTDTQGKYSNANVGISNEASRFGAGVFNQGQLTNAQLRSAFDRDNAIYGQNLINSLNAKDLGITRAFNKGWDNSFKGNMLEDMFPQVGIDRVYGDIGWSGQGRDYHTYDTYINPLTAAAAAKGKKGYADYDLDDDDWKELSAMTNKGLENGMSKDQAHAFATKMILAKKSRNNTYDPYNPGQAMAEGLGNMGWNS